MVQAPDWPQPFPSLGPPLLLGVTSLGSPSSGLWCSLRPPGAVASSSPHNTSSQSCLLRCLSSNLLLHRNTGVQPSGLSVPAQHGVSILYL